MKKILFTFLILGFLFDSCSKEEDPDSTDNPNTTVDPRKQAAEDYKNMYLPSEYSTSALNWTGNTNTCKEGTISPVAQEKILQQIKYFRKICGLPYTHITNKTAFNSKCQKMALMGAANGNSLNHNPPNTWNCYSADGASVGKSNLVYNTGGLGNPIDSWIDDPWTGSESVVHRRWILASRMKTYAFGSTNIYGVLWAHDDNNAPLPANAPAFYSYPPKYIPAPLVYNRWSFSIPNADLASGVDFTNATVAMTDAGNNPISLNIIYDDNGYMGDMTLVWVPQNINKTSATDILYNVKISGVLVNGVSKSYEYTVTIFKP